MWKIFSDPCGSALYKFHCILFFNGGVRAVAFNNTIFWAASLCNSVGVNRCLRKLSYPSLKSMGMTQDTASRQDRVRGQDVVLSVWNLQMYHRMLFSRLVLDI
jgi:hypothetical protein